MLSGLFKRLRPDASGPLPAPDAPVAVIGDVHGCAGLLEKALDQAEAPVVLVGDYIDRGEQSADVLRMLAARRDLTCLIGNHEDMLLRFLVDPKKEAGRWLGNGGLQTLASFGLDGTAGGQPADLRDRLQEAMGPKLLAWLHGLPSYWQSGNLAVVHAGADPALPMAEQRPQVLRWGHPAFEKRPRSDGLWIAHGHTIVPRPVIAAGRISVDTGAFATGRLSMALVTPDGVEFRTVT